MLWLQVKYLNLISVRFEGFSRKSSNYLWSFRCPFCGDSSYKKNKKRGYIYEKQGALQFFCHNQCGGMRFETLLKRMDARLFSEYQIEKLKLTKTKNKEEKEEAPRFDNADAYKSFNKLKCITQLGPLHPAHEYLKKRKIPNKYFQIFRWVNEFMRFTNNLVPNKFEDKVLKYDEGRILIPFYNRQDKLIGFQGRAIKPNSELRYIAIPLNSEDPMIWNLNEIDLGQDIWATEGPLDATFLNNSIAMGGCNFNLLTKTLPINKLRLVFDNEPNSRDARKKINDAIDQGLSVVIWPDNIIEKDINEMVQNGMSAEHIQYVLHQNVYSGLSAKAHLTMWSKA